VLGVAWRQPLPRTIDKKIQVFQNNGADERSGALRFDDGLEGALTSEQL